MSILSEIAEKTLERVGEAKKQTPLAEVRAHAEQLFEEQADKTSRPFEDSLKEPGLSFICEIKKASPSKGIISEHFPYMDIARAYEAGGAAGVSVLTEPYWFMGSNDILREVAGAVSTPVLRKDFTIDSYMIYEAKVLGASAVLLICEMLNPTQLRDYVLLADSLGMSALVEAHDEYQIETALDADARIIGVNNRNLKNFSVNMDNARRLRRLVPPDVVFVSESGVKTADDIKAVRAIDADAVLIGETLMRSGDIEGTLRELRGEM